MSNTATKQMTPGKKRKILNFVLIGILGIATGIFLGSWYSFTQLASSVDYSQFTENTLKDDFIKVVGEVIGIKNPSNNDVENWLAIAKSKNIKPTDLTLSQNYLLLEYNLMHSQSYSSIGTGKVETIATQSVYSAKKFDGTTYTFESVSNGMIKVAECAVMKKDSQKIKTIAGSSIKDSGATWNGKETEYLLADYKDLTGCTPDAIMPYIISTQTVLNNKASDVALNNSQEKIYYEMNISLDPIKSVINYVKQVKHTSGLSSYPEFDNITIKIKFDENWNFIRTEVVENYRVNFNGIKPKCKGTLNADYIINQPITLPI